MINEKAPPLRIQGQGLSSNRRRSDSSKPQTNSKSTSLAREQNQCEMQNNSAVAQRYRLEAELRKHPVSTIFARAELDIMMPATRVWELRYNFGLNIQTHWKIEQTSCGKNHRVAEYVLFSGKWEGKAA